MPGTKAKYAIAGNQTISLQPKTDFSGVINPMLDPSITNEVIDSKIDAMNVTGNA